MPAFAALESGWLVNGVGALTAVLYDKEWLITLKILVGGILVLELHCGVTFNGTVGSPTGTRFGEITEALDASGKTVNSGNPLSCEVTTSVLETCGKVGELATVLPLNLPWLTEMLLNGSTYEDMLPATSGYTATCSNGKKDECKGEVSSVMTNSVGENDVIGVFTETANEATCTEGVGHVGGEGLSLTISGEPLAVSEGE